MDFGIYGAYFSDFRTVASITIPLTSIALLYGFFRRTRSPQARSWSLGLMLVSSIFFWLFLALSLFLCYATAGTYELQPENAVRAVFGNALLIAIAAGLPLAIFLRYISPKIVLAKAKNLTTAPSDIIESFEALRKEMGIPAAQLRLSKMSAPISFAIDADEPLIVISERLLSLLKRDELEAVMAHELAHVKNSDTMLKALVTAYKTALPIDPLIRMVEAAFHREREMVADETAALATNKPLSLASALLKIYEAFPKSDLRSYGTLSILGAGSTLTSRHPPIRYRINQLIRLAESHR
ncbi:MAG: M48 family metalloprotease [Candidatus Bathyarchaeia archaeon]